MASPSRPPDPGGRRRSGHSTQNMLTFCALLLLLATVQTQSFPDAASPLKLKPRSITTPSVRPQDGPQPGRSPAEIPLINLDTSTYVKFRNTEDQNTNADRYRAVAPAENAVRAPLAPRSTESSGLHSLSTARSLQDWEVENIVLIATIDGAIHARDRKSGQERWSLAVPESPMIETIHHRSNRSDLDEQRPEDDYIFIVEPSKDGDLYIQHRNPSIGLQRLGVTVKSLAAQTPSWVDDPPLATTAHVESTLFVIDAATGNILKQFSSAKMFVSDNQEGSCKKTSGFELDEDSCEPFGTLHVGRNQYTVTIASAQSDQILCTIKYSEWTPNTRDTDLQSQHITARDDSHIRSYHNGRIIGMDSSTDATKPYRFTHLLESPVARVYDVLRPAESRDGSASLVMLSQPVDSTIHMQGSQWNDDITRSRVFVNQTTTGGWFALSELSYPGVTSHAPYANIFRDWRHRDFLDFEEDANDIVGVHALLSDQIRTPARALIADHPANTNESSQKAMAPVQAAEPPAIIPQPWLDLRSVFVTMFACTFIFSVFFSKRHSILSRALKVLQSLNKDIKLEPVPAVQVASHERSESIQTERSVVFSDITTHTPASHSRAQSSAVEIEAGVIHNTPKPNRRNTLENGYNSSDAEAEDDEAQESVENVTEPQDGEADPEKKKHKRGKRGRRLNKKKRQMSPEAMDETETVIVPELPTKDGLLQVGRLKINVNHDKCLGHGSNGTSVFPGVLDGREVAVKRLLRSSTSLAAKEIKHLLSSDENQHVIRYFGKEESQNFTYIALDLFAASLDQLIEHPERYPTLVTASQGFDVKDALRQVTDGVQHLHSLKLVHRDIKPQNVLVRAVKSIRLTEGMPRLQFVISDFGLAKDLEEGPESTFAPTANHTAAGTTGWRAPELLVNARVAMTGLHTTSSASNPGSQQATSEGVVLDQPSGRRATKAIDIFSLGCVFYYVMTQGQHPFDVGGTSLGRDLNIKDNNFTTEGLRLYQYEFDADDLVMQMIMHEPKHRPDTFGILRHPYFWDDTEKLDFLCAVSDCYEREKNFIVDIHDSHAIRTADEERALAELRALEAKAPNVLGHSQDFLKALPKSFINEMGRQRKYTGSKMIDLLRAIRNKKNHFHDLPDDVKEMMVSKGGGIGAKDNMMLGYFRFWSERFPSLVINCHCLVLERGLVGKFGLGEYFLS